MKKRVLILMLFVFGLVRIGELGAAEFALVSKSMDDVNFQDAAAGCSKAAALNGDTCVHIGPRGPADARLQAALLKRAARLSGQNGWREFPRSPWLSGDDTERSLEQVSLMLETDKPDVFISVGHWPIVKPDAYRKAMAPFSTDLDSGRYLMIYGVGRITPGIQGLLADRLLHGLISIDFSKIGVKVYQTLHTLSRGEQVPARIYTPNLIRTAQ